MASKSCATCTAQSPRLRSWLGKRESTSSTWSTKMGAITMMTQNRDEDHRDEADERARSTRDALALERVHDRRLDEGDERAHGEKLDDPARVRRARSTRRWR